MLRIKREESSRNWGRSRGSGRDRGGAFQQASRAVAVVLGQEALADAVGLRRDLEELVVGEELDRIVERELTDSVELRGDVRVAAAHVREVLLAHHVHLEVALADVLPDDHALVDVDSGIEEELASLLRRV